MHERARTQEEGWLCAPAAADVHIVIAILRAGGAWFRAAAVSAVTAAGAVGDAGAGFEAPAATDEHSGAGGLLADNVE